MSAAPAPTVTPELRQVLRRLKLGKMLALPERMLLAKHNQLGHAAFLELVLADEIDRRDRTGAAQRARAAGLDRAMTLHTWQHHDQAASTFQTRKLTKLEGERRKLLDAYYASAIDVTMLKGEQDRIGRDVRDVEDRLATVDAHLHEWQETLNVAMRITSNCGNAYARVGDKARRLLDTAVFSRLAVRDGKIVEYDLRPPFDILFGMPRFEYGSLVELRGIEPLTSSMRPRRSTN